MNQANAAGKMKPNDLFDVGLPQTFNLLKKNAVSEKYNKTQCNKMNHAYLPLKKIRITVIMWTLNFIYLNFKSNMYSFTHI